jgi:two-component system, OmpR family, phosphate regulon sensor histidine kinase PhoR
MPQLLTSPDLLIRILVIVSTSLIMALVTRNANYDIHFQLRKPQPISERVQIIEAPDQADILDVIKQLQPLGPSQIITSQYIYDNETKLVTPYSINEKDAEYIDFRFIQDPDGLVRSMMIKLKANSALHALVAKKYHNQIQSINYRGPPGSFEVTSFFDVNESKPRLDQKIIILKMQDPFQSFATPVGLLNEAELIANIFDNLIEHRFIPEADFTLHLVVLFSTLIISILILLYLPSTLALVATFIFAIFYLSLSLWIFDNLYIWTPIFTPLIQIFLTFLLISNYKYVLNERTKWSLEKETLLLQEVEEMKTNFLSLFSHDLKTPLAKIIGLTELMKSKTPQSELQADLDKIIVASRELERYIKRILKMSQVQSKNISLNRTPTDINSLIEKSVQQNSFAAQSKNIHFKTQLQPLFMIDVDAGLIEEVIINFIENAITYSPSNSEICVSSEETQDYIKVTVTDQGKGIPKDAQDSIWEKYYRFDSEKSGYGLGLFLSRYVIHLHGGKVFLKSKENSGSEFGFIIPINQQKIV